jgi:hypothetical protein
MRAIAWKHAPPPLAASGLDMRDGHPVIARDAPGRLSKSRFSRLGAFPAPRQLNRTSGNRKRAVTRMASQAAGRCRSRGIRIVAAIKER